MLFKKYHIVIFKNPSDNARKFQIRGWLFISIFALIAGLIGGNIMLWKYYENYSGLESNLAHAEKAVQEQKAQLLSLSQKMMNISQDLDRVRNFDSKLRVMINLDQENVQSAAPKGGSTEPDFSNNYLPLYRQELLVRKMHDFLAQLSTEAKLEEVKQQEIIHSMRSRQDALDSTPSIWPVEGWVTSPFGWRSSPFTGKREYHKGLDISCPLGTPIYAPAQGTISFVGLSGGYGRLIKINHGANLSTRYGHLKMATVKKGQVVTRGELIGYAGSTGRSTGPHVHYEVRLGGVPVSPLRYILN
ncbi:M23 family metallopeptidase [Desulfovibrio gilichinskyi]|uniref:Murein DD-endopeptidase MepM and murein hydrolase activator NlpD, contain LysM domain n=1 Tax=Desulfovibrio gilichinskyi TaxID=1519643 RepID=A0A1X7ETD1_9BACT|nr:M23 family metallopeptidase [Desulfovibrio gilichinskyi]SMF39574.1 Murein DD-endopeptidase MepM and murein hydrolase activator NlpD, contain LysM domain [Desulfovibrio gilichinskyi]